MGSVEMNFGQIVVAGGPIMIPIVFCSIFSLGIILNKLIQFGHVDRNNRQLKDEVFALLKRNKIKEAVDACTEDRGPIAVILKMGILKFGHSREEIKESMESGGRYEIPQLEKHLTVLSTIAQVTPLLGLLGTVIAMTGSFYTIQSRSVSISPVTPADLTGYIWQALIATVAGLVVAIPSFVAYNYFVSRVNDFVVQMERAGTDLVNFLCELSESKQPHSSVDRSEIAESE